MADLLQFPEVSVSPNQELSMQELPESVHNIFDYYSKKFHYLALPGDASDLYQMIVTDLWPSILATWPMCQQKSARPNFEMWVKFRLKRYLIDLKKHFDSQKRTWERSNISLNRSISTDDGEVTTEQFLGKDEPGYEAVENRTKQQDIIDSIDDPAAARAVEIIFDSATGQDVWPQIEEETGKTLEQLKPLLISNPLILEVLRKKSSTEQSIF
jgi:hypothetical protein